jgi:hypothetical protein
MPRSWFPSTTENLLAKAANLGEQVAVLEADGLPPAQLRLLDRCRQNLEAVDRLQRPWRPHHPNLAWRYLHHVDEDLYLLLPREQVLADAYDLQIDFDRNIIDTRLRNAWLGTASSPGRLDEAIAALENRAEEIEARHLLREARHLLDAQADMSFWTLSVSTLTIVASGFALAAAMLAYALLGYGAAIERLARLNLAEQLHRVATGVPDLSTLVALALLGLMGGYLSNMLTRVNFLFPAGGPFWRFVLLHLVARPVMSAFGAVLIMVLIKSGLIFAVNPIGNVAPGVVVLQVPEGALGYTYASLAVACGFGSDKVLRAMIGRVLQVLQLRAEKTNPPPAPPSREEAAKVDVGG